MIFNNFLNCLLLFVLPLLGETNRHKRNHARYGPCANIPFTYDCIKLGSKTYVIHVSEWRVNWFGAVEFCRRLNGFLVNIESEEELRLISNFLIAQNYLVHDKKFWIGNNDLTLEGVFMSVKTGGLIEYAKWTKGSPKKKSKTEDCVHLWQRDVPYTMNDINCYDSKFDIICELEEYNSTTKCV